MATKTDMTPPIAQHSTSLSRTTSDKLNQAAAATSGRIDAP
jgi:hypothetical protein